MKTYIKRVPQFSAVQFRGLENIDDLLVLTGQSGYRVESNGGQPVVYLKTTEERGKFESPDDLRMERRQWLVRSPDGMEVRVLNENEFHREFEVAP